MKIFPHIEQGTEEWRALRSKYFTASTLGDWLIEEPRLDLTVAEMTAFLTDMGTPPNKGAKWAALAALMPVDVVKKHTAYTARRNDAWENAIEARLGSISLDEEPEWDTWATKRGKLLEPDARAAYENHAGLATVTVGFCAHDSDDFGNSPDALVPNGAITLADADKVEAIPGYWYWNGVELKCHIARTHLRFLRRGGFREEHAMQVHASMAATGIREWHLFGYHPELPPLFEKFHWDETTDKVLAGLLRLSEDYWTAYEGLKAMHQARKERAA